MTDNKNDAGMSALLTLKTEGEGLAKQGAAIARANAFDSDMDVIAANNKLSVMRIKNGMLNDKITRLAAENSELRALLEKRNEILGKIRAGIKAKIMASDAIATVMDNYSKKTGKTSDEIKNDLFSSLDQTMESGDAYSRKADDQLVLAGADEEVMAAVNEKSRICTAPNSTQQENVASKALLATKMLLDSKTSMVASIANTSANFNSAIHSLGRVIFGSGPESHNLSFCYNISGLLRKSGDSYPTSQVHREVFGDIDPKADLDALYCSTDDEKVELGRRFALENETPLIMAGEAALRFQMLKAKLATLSEGASDEERLSVLKEFGEAGDALKHCVGQVFYKGRAMSLRDSVLEDFKATKEQRDGLERKLFMKECG